MGPPRHPPPTPPNAATAHDVALIAEVFGQRSEPAAKVLSARMFRIYCFERLADISDGRIHDVRKRRLPRDEATPVPIRRPPRVPIRRQSPVACASRRRPARDGEKDISSSTRFGVASRFG